ncbi:MAG: glycosyl transferase [SAR86 cluster bacterium]|uniref:Glycosyl transferase n=1 Tax=SAR86 cluster bacterium TaxID=2030880 RepID=A0A2A5B6X0_9GAMM|nr:MAG: glycosyl transferase [SAR86 cluster bacterium]
MPAYNASQYLLRSANSAFEQTYSNWELLIVDDASTDNTLLIAEQLAARDSRVTVLRQINNQGVAQARNLALDSAQGKYIAFLDSDDLWHPEKLQKQVQFMESSDTLICYAAYQRIDENGEKMGQVWPPTQLSYHTLLKSNFIGNLTGIYNADSLGKQYFTKLKHEDYVAWLALVKKAGLARSINEILGSYRVYAGSTSSNKLKTIAWQWRIYRIGESLGLIRSCWLMFCYAYHAIYKRL